MRTFQRLLYFLVIIGCGYIGLELSKRLQKTTPEALMTELDAPPSNLPDLPEATNLPDVLFNKEYLRWQPNNKCAKFPTYEEIVTSNRYWQVLFAPNRQPQAANMYHQEDNLYYLFGAYLDSRGPDVKLLGMMSGQPQELFCNVWFERGIEPKTIPAAAHYVWNKNWRMKPHLLNPYLFSCKLPSNLLLNKSPKIPKAVSLIVEPCERATNLLKVNHIIKEEPTLEENEVSILKRDFMVCVKGLEFPEDVSYKLIEWIEIIRLLGADKIHFYVINVHKNVAKVLDHYKQVGWIITEGLSYPGKAFTKKNRPQTKRHELIPYNDCFYKHREEYKYVILLDVDEIIMPNIGNWKDLIAKMHKESNDATSTFSLSNAYFFDELKSKNQANDIQEDFIMEQLPGSLAGDVFQQAEPLLDKLHMLRHVYRTRNMTQPSLFVKGFHNSTDVLSLHNHFPIECKQGFCKETKIAENEAKLAHYRSCPALFGDTRCDRLKEDFVRDDSIARIREEAFRNVRKTVGMIGL